MQSTGQTSTHELSLVPMHGSAMTYAISVECSFLNLGRTASAPGGGRRNHTSNRSLPAGHGGWLRAPCVWLADGGARQTSPQPVTRGSTTRSGEDAVWRDAVAARRA